MVEKEYGLEEFLKNLMLKINLALPRLRSDKEFDKSCLFSFSDELLVIITQSINLDGGVFLQ
jgi:hypothetical protein